MTIDDFPTTSNHILKISEDSSKIVQRPCVSYLEVLKLIFHYILKKYILDGIVKDTGSSVCYRLTLSSRYNTWNSKGYFCLNFRTHPEVPDRIQRPYDKHKEYGLLERCQILPVSEVKIMLYKRILGIA